MFLASFLHKNFYITYTTYTHPHLSICLSTITLSCVLISMELLTGYMSSDEDINKDDKISPRPSLPPSGKSTLQRPLAGSVNAAPLLFVPIAVLRSKGLLSGGLVALSTGSNLCQLAVQGPMLLNDPNDAVASFVCAIDPKTGSTTKIAADAAADEFIFAKN